MADYISRKELIEHLDKCRNDPLFDPDMARICFAIGIFIKNMEAADVQPVKHGRWIISNIYAQCSECSVAYDLDTFQRLIPMHENVPRYCSYCGARMDLGDEKT